MQCKKCEKEFNKCTQVGGYIENEWYCNKCIYNQPERSKREDINHFGKTAIFNDGLCYMEDGRIIDPEQEINDAVL